LLDSLLQEKWNGGEEGRLVEGEAPWSLHSPPHVRRCLLLFPLFLLLLLIILLLNEDLIITIVNSLTPG